MAVRSRKGRPEPRTPPPVLDPDATFTERYKARTEWRNEEARADLEPLAPGERPKAVTIAAIVALAMAVLNVAAALSGRTIAGDEGSQTTLTIITTAILVVIGLGMLARRYWAVLGFEIVLGLQITAMSLALVFAANVGAAALLLVLVVLLGTLFWKLIRAMARMQMPVAGPGSEPAQPVQ
jgi:hypothetical protein